MGHLRACLVFLELVLPASLRSVRRLHMHASLMSELCACVKCTGMTLPSVCGGKGVLYVKPWQDHNLKRSQMQSRIPTPGWADDGSSMMC